MRRIVVREEGLVGTYFAADADAAIIILGGSSGGVKEDRARHLAAMGFSVFALSYFASEHLPHLLKNIPLEYFERAIAYVRKQKGIQSVGIWGISRGTEAALLMGSLHPSWIQAIALHVPNCAVYGAFDSADSPAWTFRGKPILPSAPFMMSAMEGRGEELDPLRLTPSFLRGMQEDRFVQSEIPVEKIRCPLLLISGEDDEMWPSAPFCRRIKDRLARHQTPIECTHFSYPRVGHCPGVGSKIFHPIWKRWLSYGGNGLDNAAAAIEWGRQTVQFFKKNLTNTPLRSLHQ